MKTAICILLFLLKKYLKINDWYAGIPWHRVCKMKIIWACLSKSKQLLIQTNKKKEAQKQYFHDKKKRGNLTNTVLFQTETTKKRRQSNINPEKNISTRENKTRRLDQNRFASNWKKKKNINPTSVQQNNFHEKNKTRRLDQDRFASNWKITKRKTSIQHQSNNIISTRKTKRGDLTKTVLLQTDWKKNICIPPVSEISSNTKNAPTVTCPNPFCFNIIGNNTPCNRVNPKWNEHKKNEPTQITTEHFKKKPQRACPNRKQKTWFRKKQKHTHTPL